MGKNPKSKLKTIRYKNTIGMYAWVPQARRWGLVRIACDELEDGSRKLYVESGHNLAVYKSCGVKYLEHDAVAHLFDHYDRVQEFHNFASLFGISTDAAAEDDGWGMGCI